MPSGGSWGPEGRYIIGRKGWKQEEEAPTIRHIPREDGDDFSSFSSILDVQEKMVHEVIME